MKKLFILFGILISAGVSAQIYVSSGSYVYVNDQMVFVKQNVNLQNNGNIFLRDNSQFLQGSASASANTGQGKLSVFQEGTSDNYDYNYWCSPVGNASAATGNEPFGVTMLGSPTTVTATTPAIMLPMSNANGVASPFSIAPRWVFKFVTSSNYSQWVAVGSASTLAAGEGFTMKGTGGTDATTVLGVQNNSGSAQRYDFRGKPNDGDITINVANGQMTLTGNPYPSAMDLTAFLTAATNCTGVAYFWEQDKTVNSHVIFNYKGGYGVFSPISRGGTGIYVPAAFFTYDGAGTQLANAGTGSVYSRLFSPVGQGFMIEGNAGGSTVTMRNAYRVYQKENVATSVFERPADNGFALTPENTFLPEIQSVSGFDYTTVSTAPVPQIRFNTMFNNQGIRQSVLAFDQSATDGVDHAMDAKSPGDEVPADIYFALDGTEYVISVIDFDITKKIPLGLKNTAEANFKITVSEMLNFDQADHVYIHDKLNDTYFDIKDAVYEVTMPAGNNTERFEITFLDSALGTGEIKTDGFTIFQDNTNQQLTITNPDMLDVKSVLLFDLTGKLIFNKAKLGARATYQFPTSGLSEAVYIVKLVTADNQDISKKVSVFKAQ